MTNLYSTQLSRAPGKKELLSTDINSLEERKRVKKMYSLLTTMQEQIYVMQQEINALKEQFENR